MFAESVARTLRSSVEYALELRSKARTCPPLALALTCFHRRESRYCWDFRSNNSTTAVFGSSVSVSPMYS